METLKQQALDYTLGVLPKDESLLFEAMLETDEDAQKLLIEAQEDCANLSMTANPKTLGNEVRSRVMEHCEPRMDFNPFLESNDMTRLRDNFSFSGDRYRGGGGSVDIGDIIEPKLKDEVRFNYENLIDIFPLLSGNSKAANGNLSELQDRLRKSPPLDHAISSILQNSLPEEDPSIQSVLRTTLTSLPSLSFFSDRIRENHGGIADTRRLFYLCRDQLKIMRASFKDLDPERLIEDEKIRLHGAGLLQTKWWGAEHAYFSSKGKVKCGHFFDGPVSERCVEFAEYDANMYCLANLLAPRSSTGEFHMELLKDAIPGCTLAVATAVMSDQQFHEIELATTKSVSTSGNGKLSYDRFLWSLIEESMLRGHHSNNLQELREKRIFGISRLNGFCYIWFAWPAIS